MKTFARLVAIVTAFGFVGAASAADMPTKAPMAAPAQLYNWNGFYIGGSVGGRWSDVDWRTANTTPAPLAITGPNNPASLDGSSARLGGYIGYNWQFAPTWLAGLEADIAWARNNNSVSPFPGTPGGALGAGPTNVDTVKLGWDGSVRGRVGFLVSPMWLVYGTGGVAFQQIKTISDCGTGVGFCGVTVSGTSSTVKVSWTVGGGVEMALSNRWMARVEYRYADFGHVSNDLPPAPAFGLHSNISVRTNTALAGFAYKF